jgi:hypothetical protein
MANRYGLTRDIPEPVKRVVRQRCGFGCVVCAGAIVDYEHFNPDFARARRHDPSGITLLCPLCHAKRTRNMLSIGRVRDANASPAALTRKYAFSELEGTARRPFVKLAGMTLKNCETPLQVGGYPALKIEDAEVENGPYRLSATFFDSRGQPSLLIRENEWRVLTESWDVEVAGPNITVRTAPREIALRLQLTPGEGLIVDRLDMLCAGYRLVGNADLLDVYFPGGGKQSFIRGLVDNCKIGFSLN